MEFTKPERILLMSLVAHSIGIEASIELLGKEKVEKLEVIAKDLAGNTTPNEMAMIGPSVIKGLANSLLELYDDEQPEGYKAPFTIIDETVEGSD